MVDFTILEIHLHDAAFTANAPFADSSEEDGAEDGDTSAGDSGPDRPSPRPFVIGIVALVFVAFAVRKFMGSGDADLPEVDDLEIEA